MKEILKMILKMEKNNTKMFDLLQLQTKTLFVKSEAQQQMIDNLKQQLDIVKETLGRKGTINKPEMPEDVKFMHGL